MLNIDHVTMDLGKTRALDDLSLHVAEGQIFGLLGPNGAGKTTLIRLIMGLQRPSRGGITLFGKYRPGEPAVRRQMGYMPQQLAVYRGLSVWENILFYGRMYQLDEAALARQADEVLQMVELERWRDSPVATLSGGMIRRVMLATALVHKPRLLLLDEPTAGVDPLLRLRFWDWFRQMVEAGTSIIVTTHNIAEAAHCGQAVFLRQGHILEQGSPQQLVSKYACDDLEQAFVAAIHQQGEAQAQEIGP